MHVSIYSHLSLSLSLSLSLTHPTNKATPANASRYIYR